MVRSHVCPQEQAFIFGGLAESCLAYCFATLSVDLNWIILTMTELYPASHGTMYSYIKATDSGHCATFTEHCMCNVEP